jgi:hypothetical protein
MEGLTLDHSGNFSQNRLLLSLARRFGLDIPLDQIRRLLYDLVWLSFTFGAFIGAF